MKRSGFSKPRKPFTSKPKRVKPVSDRKAAYRASEDGRKAMAYMAAVRAMPCIICDMHDEPQKSPTQFHHTIHGRFSSRKTADLNGIGLCEGHHLGMIDTSKVAIHAEPDRWKELYGLDTDYIAETKRRIGEME